MLPPPDRIAAWKREHHEVFAARHGTTDYVFRAVSSYEYEQALAAGPDQATSDVEEALVRTALLWPEDCDLDHTPAGTVSSLAGKIREYSAFEDALRTRSLLEEWRHKYSGLRGQMDAVIMNGLPNYDHNLLKHLTMYEKAELCVLAEVIINMRMQTSGINGEFKLQVLTPEEIEAAGKKKIDEGNATVDDPIARKLHGMR